MPAGLMPDLARMQRDRLGRLRALLAAQGLDALVLLGNTHVQEAYLGI